MSGRVVAIDGPAASGKSTTARSVADALGFEHLNSGLLYRAIAWAALRRGWAGRPVPASGEAGSSLDRRVGDVELELVAGRDGYGVRVEGRDPGQELRDAAVTRLASVLSARASVRRRVTDLVRNEARLRDVVCDGRDIGTVVFPHADLKVFLDADADERARRRLRERGEETTAEAVLAESGLLRQRDRADATRPLSPLRPAPDALRVDTTRLSPSEVVYRILEEARQRGIGPRQV